MRKIRILLLFILVFFSNINATCKINHCLEVVINENLQKVSFSDLDVNPKVISLFFYNIGHDEFLSVVISSGYSKSTFKGYCFDEDLLIVYTGCEDYIANKFLSINSLVKNTDAIEEFDLDKCNCGIELAIPPSYYKAKEGKLKKFTPNKRHNTELKELLIKKGFILLPPPLE